MAAATVKTTRYHVSGKYIKEALLKQILKNAFPDMTEEAFDVKMTNDVWKYTAERELTQAELGAAQSKRTRPHK